MAALQVVIGFAVTVIVPQTDGPHLVGQDFEGLFDLSPSDTSEDEAGAVFFDLAAPLEIVCR